LTVHRSKEDQESKGETLFVGPPTMQAIDRYRDTGRIEKGALFRRVRRGGHVTSDRLGVEGARIAIKARARAAGVEGFISGHSLRVGSAVSLARAGASVVDMQVAGRWKSPQMPAH
jgi:integrase